MVLAPLGLQGWRIAEKKDDQQDSGSQRETIAIHGFSPFFDPNRKSVFLIFGMLIGDEYRNGFLGSDGLDVRILASFSFYCAGSVLPTSEKRVA